MIETVTESDAQSPADEKPVVFTPVSAEEFSRRRARNGWIIGAVIAALVAATGYIYKRTTDPLHAKESFDAGTRLLNTARYNQAIFSFDRAIHLKSDFSEAYLLRGKSYVGVGQVEESLRDFTKVTELQPSNPAGWIARGSAYLDLNNFQAAVADASKAIKVSPNESAAYTLRGMALRKSGNPQKALADFNRAVSLAPTTPNYFDRGTTYQMLGQHQAAISDLNHVIDVIPDLATAFFARAESRRAIGDLQGAKKDHAFGRVLDGR
jgi:tetratricopeptide (TPR) repeat protein